ncbi:MAG TPA: pseudouridine synthase [bacterium]|nr:pseudouridine synthase [bacterium]
MQGERLQKVLAGWGLGSRRAIEQWIAAGEVKVNGEVATLGSRMLPTDRVEIRGQPVRSRVESFTRRVLMYHKPEGELTTRFDPEGRPTVFESLPPIRDGRWITVGRLDFNTSGLLIVTNDGELANRMMHPSQELLRVYAARVFGDLTQAMIKQLKEGVELEDGVAHFESVEDAGGTGMNHWYHVGLREGRNREVRRMFEAVGVPVSRLIRIQYGDMVLPPRLRPGKWNMLTAEEAEALAVSMGMPSKKSTAEALPAPRRSPVRPAFPQRSTAGREAGVNSREHDGEARPRSSERSRTPAREAGARRGSQASVERKTYVVRAGRAEREELVTKTEGRPERAGERKASVSLRASRPEARVNPRRESGQGGAERGSEREPRRERSTEGRPPRRRG